MLKWQAARMQAGRAAAREPQCASAPAEQPAGSTAPGSAALPMYQFALPTYQFGLLCQGSPLPSLRTRLSSAGCVRFRSSSRACLMASCAAQRQPGGSRAAQRSGAAACLPQLWRQRTRTPASARRAALGASKRSLRPQLLPPTLRCSSCAQASGVACCAPPPSNKTRPCTLGWNRDAPTMPHTRAWVGQGGATEGHQSNSTSNAECLQQRVARRHPPPRFTNHHCHRSQVQPARHVRAHSILGVAASCLHS